VALDVGEKRIPATVGKNALLAVIVPASFYVNFGLIANGDIARGILVQLLSCMVMFTVMKYAVE
jgi:hypothetical protein